MVTMRVQSKQAIRPSARWWGAGFAAVGAAVAVVVRGGLGPWPILAFALAPDLAFLAGIGQPVGRAQIAPRAVPLYNAVHRFTLPLVMAVTAAAGVLSAWWLAAALTWAAHIAFDRAVGYGLRTPEGWQRG